MIDTVVSVKLPIGEMLRIKRNRLMPDHVTGEEKRICLVSGIYGDELGGQYICGEIIRRIKAEFHNLTGIVDVYPAVNPLGLDARTRAVPISDIDYSSAFPGDINGGLEDYTAAKLLEDIKGASCCIDIHSSNIFLQEVPQVRLNDDYDETLLHLSKYMNTDLVWIHPSQTVNEGSLAYALNQMGIPTMVTESGAAFRIRYEYCRQIDRNISLCLCHYSMLLYLHNESTIIASHIIQNINKKHNSTEPHPTFDFPSSDDSFFPWLCFDASSSFNLL